MANEIGYSVILTCNNGESSVSFRPGSGTANQAALGFVGEIVSVSTTAAIIPLGSVSTLGFAYFVNTDPVNYVQIGVTVSATFYPVQQLAPKESYIWRFDPACVPYWKAHTAACFVQYGILQN